jgi:hypothetical protein
MARRRFVGSGRAKEGGFLATHRQDFDVHTKGTDWRHTADQTDMNPPLVTFPAPTVQGTLEAIEAYLIGGGGTFVTIGDGYARGDFNIGDAGIPTLEAAFTAALATPRLQNGGTILLKPGVYQLTSTITLPAGISVMGDLAGTYINNSASNVPMFKVLRSLKFFNRGSYPTVIGDPQTAPELISYQADINRFFNLILSDHMYGNTVAMSTSPMIQLECGSNVVVERVTFLGRTRNAGPYEATHRGIAYTSSSSRPTSLTVKDCTFDVVKSAIEFTATEGAADTLRITGCRARTVGELYAGNTTNCFCSFNLCNATLVNNHHIGLSTGAGAQYGSDRCFHINSNVPSNNDVRVVITGNSGGLYLPSNDDYENNFLVDGRSVKTTAFEGVISGNSWGHRVNNDWYLTVGDGIGSVGDIVGLNAVDIALIRSRSSVSLSTIVINKGSYTVTETGDVDQLPKLVGNTPFQKPTLTLTGSSTDGPLNHSAIWVGSELHNINFTAAGGMQSLLMHPGKFAGADKRYHVSNCAFNDVNLTINLTLQGLLSSVVIEDCRFGQSGTYPNTYSLVMTEATEFIDVSRCVFYLSTGYAMFIGDTTGATYSSVQRINVTACQFEAFNNTAKSITDTSPLGSSKSNFIYIANEDCTSDVTFRDTTIYGVSDTTPGSKYDILDPAITDKYIRVLCGTLTVDNCKTFGPYQTHTSGTLYSLPTWYIMARRGVQLLNSRFFGSLPVQISQDNQGLNEPNQVLGQYGTGAWLRIDGCELSGYDDRLSVVGFWTPTVLDVELEQFAGSVNTSNGMVNITNSSFYATNDDLTSSPIAAEHQEYTGFTDYHTIGCVQIYGEGWGVHFANNDVNVIFSANANPFFAGHAAVVLDVVSDASQDLAGACAIIDANRINLRSFWSGLTISYMDVIVAKAQYPTITGNHVRYSASIATGARRFIYTEADSGYDSSGTITGNTFFRDGAAPLGSFFNFVGGRGVCSDNAMTEATLYFRSDTTNDDWIVERNKGQQVITRVRAPTGRITQLDDIWTSSMWPDVSSIVRGYADILTSGGYNIRLNLAVGGGGVQQVNWLVDLQEIVPYGATLTDVVISAECAAGAAFNSASITSYVSTPNGPSSDIVVGSDMADLKATSPAIQTLTVSGLSVPMSARPFVNVKVLCSASSGTPTIDISALIIYYEW